MALVKALTMSRRSSRHATLRQAAAVLSTALQYAVANIDYGDRFTGFPLTLPTIVPPPGAPGSAHKPPVAQLQSHSPRHPEMLVQKC